MRYLITLIPSCFMTAVCVTYICVDKIGFNLPMSWTPYIAVASALICIVIFCHMVRKNKGVSMGTDSL